MSKDRMRQKESGRIILPKNARVDDIAAREVAEQQAMENHPVFKLLVSLRKELFAELARVSEQNRQMAIRMHALFDYLNSLGVLAWQGIDQETGKVLKDAPVVTEVGSMPLLDNLISGGFLPAMPPRGFDACIEDHMDLSYMIIHLNMLHRRDNIPMNEIIQLAREFNNTPGRVNKITGEQIMLVDYLNQNPDKLSDDEITVLAAEFKLRLGEDKHGVGEVRATNNDTQVSQEEPSSTPAAMPVEGSVGPQEADPN